MCTCLNFISMYLCWGAWICIWICLDVGFELAFVTAHVSVFEIEVFLYNTTVLKNKLNKYCWLSFTSCTWIYRDLFYLCRVLSNTPIHSSMRREFTKELIPCNVRCFREILHFWLTLIIADMLWEISQSWKTDNSRSPRAWARKTAPVQLLWTRFCGQANLLQTHENAQRWKTFYVSQFMT